MVTWKEYKRKRESFWRGKKVKTLREMQNGNFVIPLGTVMVISRKYMGFTLRKIDTCTKCEIGRKLIISRVEPTVLALLDK